MKNNIIKFRVSKMEQLLIKKKANDSGITVSELIRSLLLNYKPSSKLTPDEIECFKTLSKYADNFRRISNYINSKNLENLKSEIMQTSTTIREHLMKLK